MLVLDAGALKYQGTVDEVVASGYQIDRDMDAQEDNSSSPNGDEPEAAAATAAPVQVHVAQKGTAEAPIPKASMGLTPYLFYMRMAGWWGSLIVIVSHPSIVPSTWDSNSRIGSRSCCRVRDLLSLEHRYSILPHTYIPWR